MLAPFSSPSPLLERNATEFLNSFSVSKRKFQPSKALRFPSQNTNQRCCSGGCSPPLVAQVPFLERNATEFLNSFRYPNANSNHPKFYLSLLKTQTCGCLFPGECSPETPPPFLPLAPGRSHLKQKHYRILKTPLPYLSARETIHGCHFLPSLHG